MFIGDLVGVGEKRCKSLEASGIFTTADLLSFYPITFENWTNVKKVIDLDIGEKCAVILRILSVRNHYLRGRKGMMLNIKAKDESGILEIVYFNAKHYQEQTFLVGNTYAFYGNISSNKNGTLNMINPLFQDISGENYELNIKPVYPTIKGISQNLLRKLILQAIEANANAEEIKETLPSNIIKLGNLCSREFALKNIHFPQNRSAYAMAKYRLIYEELFFFQLGLFLKGNTRCKDGCGISYPKDESIDDFLKFLSFVPTDAQMRVLKEIEKDMERDVPMQRLINGDVGSGKTIIAAAALYKAAVNGYQCVMMVPTELLAMQHYKNFCELFKDTDLKIEMLSSKLKVAQKRKILERLRIHDIDILIGTNSVIQTDVEYNCLGLVVTDEQHRFGVSQRLALAQKGDAPDVLVMTATPIPRTLAMVLYGEFDISIIDELPKGRRQIDTFVKPISARASIYRSARKELEEGHQVYAVAPLVADSEVLDAMSSETLFIDLKKRFSEYKVGLVNGSMKQDEKDDTMSDFAKGKIQILVATVVIEVGINVPNATMMIIENAERFGLAQLHQLRGRVGRGRDKSYCVLLVDPKKELGYERAKVIAATSDGFSIADRDLEMRGPGDFFGTRQHGIFQLKLADLSCHMKIFNNLRQVVKEILQKDPKLRNDENRLLLNGVEKMFGNLNELII